MLEHDPVQGAKQPESNSELTAIKKLKQRNRELAILKDIAEELNRAVDVKSALETALGLVAELLGVQTGWVWLLDEASGEPFLAASRMLPPFLTDKPSRMRGKKCHCLESFLEGDLRPANINVLECSRLHGEVDATKGLRYHASIPIYAHDKPLGVMNVASSDWRRLEDNDLELLRIIGYQMGVALERARLFDQTARLATAEERNRLAREIHDTIAQGLAATILNLESAEIFLDGYSGELTKLAKAREKVRKALNLARANLEEARRSVLDLRAAPLQEKLLVEALSALVENFALETSVEAQFVLADGTSANRRYPARVEAGVYRVAQEALTNIRKHAKARSTRVSFQTELVHGKERLVLTIKDDGVGFDAASLETKTGSGTQERGEHFGLIGMNERARLLGGELEIDSCPGQGTYISFIVPLS